MKAIRAVKKVFKSVPTLEGAGVHLKRAFGYHEVPELDPFLMEGEIDQSLPTASILGGAASS
jgi:redox-sensitive bicupin YhaK (pirin superfamily)